MGLRRILYFGLSIVLLSLNAQKKDFQEEVYISLNTTNILVGETLFFSAFVYSNTSKKTSKLSSILYVELVDESGRPVHQTKIGLSDGRGSGSIYVNPAWMSSTYRIVAYTRWMMNYNSFFEQNVLVLNPYNGVIQNAPLAGNPLRNSKDLSENVDTYAPLQDISMNLGVLLPGTFSIAISKTTSLYYPNEVALENPSVELQSFEILPEYRYALVQGNVKRSSGNIDQLRVNMTIKGSSMQVATTKTDRYGRFWMSYNPDLSASAAEVLIQLEEDSVEQIRIVNEFYEKHDSMPSGNTNLDSVIIGELIERSVNSQIQRAYQKQDNLESESRNIFTQPDAKVFYLDDYKRFSSVRDTFIELIKYVGVSKSEDNYRMNVRCEETPGLISSNKSPLILLDGIKVDPEDILNQSPNDIEKIEVIPEYYFVNDVVYKGLISVHTFGRIEPDINTKGQKIPLTNYQLYSENGYALRIDNRLPLYESDIYWEPIHTHNGGQLILDFSTSRLEGTYKVSVAGISKTGKPVNLITRFRVLESGQ